jgi:Zn-dependent M28 family amino/carboxypeptidase
MMSPSRFGSRPAVIALSLTALLFVHFASTENGTAARPDPRGTSDSALAAGLKAHLDRLTSHEMEGRQSGSAGFRRASEYAAQFFASAGLEAGWTGRDGKGTLFQPVPSPRPEVPECRNVVALLRGSDPALRGEFVTLGAHLDHLGIVGGALYPGANDDASGCAAVLEAARVLAAAPPKRSVLFVLFTEEETGHWGSLEFVKHPPVPMDKVVMNVNVEQIGSRHREFPGIFAIGPMSLKAPFDEAVARVPAYRTQYGDIKKFLEVVAGSDTWSFVLDKRPAIILGSGGFREHHTPQDTVDLIDLEQMARATALIIDYVRALAGR